MSGATDFQIGYVPFFLFGDEFETTGIALGVGERTEDEALAWAKREAENMGLDEVEVVFVGCGLYRVANEIECRCKGIHTYGDGAWVEAKRMPTKHGGEFYVFDFVAAGADTQEGGA